MTRNYPSRMNGIEADDVKHTHEWGRACGAATLRGLPESKC